MRWFNAGWFFLIGLVVILVWVFGLGIVGDNFSDEGVRLAPEFSKDKIKVSLTLEGVYGTSIVDYFEEDRAEYLDYINVNGELIPINLNDGVKNLRYGDLIEVGGYYGQSEIGEIFNVVESRVLEVGGGKRFVGNPVLGGQKTAVIVINWDGIPEEEMFTARDIYNEIFNPDNPDSTTNWFLEASYGKTWLEGGIEDVYGVYEWEDPTMYWWQFNYVEYLSNILNFDETDYRRILFIRAE